MKRQYSKKYFDNYSQGKGYLLQNNNLTGAKRIKEIKALKKTKGRLLDVGCAFGFFLDLAKTAGFKTYGLDISQYTLLKANKEHQVNNIDVSQEKIPFKSNFFDVITLSHTLEHLTNPFFALKETRRVLKIKGLLFIETPLRKRWTGDKTHFSYFDKISLRFILENLDFKILKIGEEGGKLRNIFGIIRLLYKKNTLFNFVPQGTGSFLVCYCQKK